MFFRREKPKQLTFQDYLDNLKQFGFDVQTNGSTARVSKLGSAAILRDRGNGVPPEIGKAGVIIGNELGHLVNGGYQQFFRTESGKVLPAAATHLRALHDFQEDMKEALGMPSFYNQGLGTVSSEHLYDRVEERDHEHETRPWQR
ncbi:MAG TPA: hypothetical protein VE621_24385 [Bryobacteraceae bacterium]|jgi:hypothetical protein|nr:hypothetical protein [Bryobacteraceae bacterium]